MGIRLNMFDKNELPTPFNIFWIVFMAQWGVFAFFVENKQQGFIFYFVTGVSVLLFSLLSSYFIYRIKKPLGLITVLDDDELFEENMKERSQLLARTRMTLTFLALLQLIVVIAALLALTKLYISK